MTAFAAIALLMFGPSSRSVGADTSKFDPKTGYRIARYRAPVPETVPGGTRIFVDDVERLIAGKSVIMLDVMAATGPGPDPKTGRWRITKSHMHIPGSVWLPDVGKGKIDAAIRVYLSENLMRLTKGDKSHPIIIYCQADCWMSWNAVKRLAEMGYTKLYWYPEGTDGWSDWDGALVPAKPVPLRLSREIKTDPP